MMVAVALFPKHAGLWPSLSGQIVIRGSGVIARVFSFDHSIAYVQLKDSCLLTNITAWGSLFISEGCIKAALIRKKVNFGEIQGTYSNYNSVSDNIHGENINQALW